MWYLHALLNPYRNPQVAEAAVATIPELHKRLAPPTYEQLYEALVAVEHREPGELNDLDLRPDAWTENLWRSAYQHVADFRIQAFEKTRKRLNESHAKSQLSASEGIFGRMRTPDDPGNSDKLLGFVRLHFAELPKSPLHGKEALKEPSTMEGALKLLETISVDLKTFALSSDEKQDKLWTTVSKYVIFLQRAGLMPTQDQDLHIRDGRQGCIISPARTGNAQKGDSGGPVVTVDGKLHGVIVGGIEGEGNLLTAYGNSTNQSSETIRVPSFFCEHILLRQEHR